MINLRTFALAILAYFLDSVLQPDNRDRRKTLAYCGFVFAAFNVLLNDGGLNKAAAFGLGLGMAAFFEVLVDRQRYQAAQNFFAGFN